MIITTRPDTNHAECVETNSFIPASHAFERFKEDLLDFFWQKTGQTNTRGIPERKLISTLREPTAVPPGLPIENGTGPTVETSEASGNSGGASGPAKLASEMALCKRIYRQKAL